jgi:hypothetical protein
MKALTQAAVNYTHAAALRHVVAGAMAPRIGAAPALLAAAGLEGAAELPGPNGAAPERDLLLAAVLVNQALVVRIAAASVRGVEEVALTTAWLRSAAGALERGAAFWGEPARAARAEERLAELGVARGEGVAAAARAAMLETRVELIGALQEDVVPALEEDCGANPRALRSASLLATTLSTTDPRRGYTIALAALARGKRAGHEFAPAQLARDAADLIACGTLGEHYRIGAVRLLFARARLLLDASKPSGAAPLPWWQSADAVLAVREARLASLADMDDDAECTAVCARFSMKRMSMLCKCAGCGTVRPASSSVNRATEHEDNNIILINLHSPLLSTQEASEMLVCSRCRGTPAQALYCSPACQKAHWPEHRAACKAAAAAARRGG